MQSQGYVVLDFFSNDIKQNISSFLEKYLPIHFDAFHTTHFSNNVEYKKQVHQAILDFFKEAFIRHISEDFMPVFANFMLKKGTGNNPMPLHADWAYVDELDHVSYAIWIPLIDTNEQNGGLCVIPYSQNLSCAIRGPRILQWEFPANEILIQKAGISLNLKLGQAVIYNHRLLHYSPPNFSGLLRPAVNISLVPKNVLQIHYAVPENTDFIHVFDAGVKDFYFRYSNFQMPEKANLIQQLPLSAAPLWNKKVENFLQQYFSKKWWKLGWKKFKI